MRINHLVAPSLLLACVVGQTHAQTCGQAQDLGTLQGGSYAWAEGLSRDGSVIVGWGATGLSDAIGFRWSQSDGMQPLPTLGGTRSYARAVSGDGSIVVGEASDTNQIPRAFRWSVLSGIENIGTLAGFGSSAARAISDDGNVVVGEILNLASGQLNAFRWTQAGGMQILIPIQDYYSVAHAISADGGVVAGEFDCQDCGELRRAMYWSQATGGLDLSGLLGVDWWCEKIIDVSDDGRWLVGIAWQYPNGYARSFRVDSTTWETTLLDFGTGAELGNELVRGVSGDGLTTIAMTTDRGGFLLSDSHGLVSLGTGNNPTALAASGSVVAGYIFPIAQSQNFHALRWEACSAPACDSIDFNADGLFPDDADLIDFLSVFAGGPCSTGSCNDIDFNNDGLFPDDADLSAFLAVLAGGAC